MNRKATHWTGSSLLALLLVATGCGHTPADSTANPDSSATGQPQTASEDSKHSKLGELLATKKEITIPDGTAVEVTVDETLSSKSNRAGDTFQASLAAPILRDGKTVVPKGAHVAGRVVDAKESGRLHAPAILSVALSSIEVQGKSYDVVTNTIGETGKNHNKRNLGFIGGGAAAGALIGGLAGGGKGALIGGAAGAGAGTAGAAATGKKDISIPAETRLTFHLARSVTISVKE